MSKKRIRRILLFVAIIGIAAVAISKVNIQTTKEYYSATEAPSDKVIQVSIGIYCDTILSNYQSLDKSLQDEKYVPKDGVILTETTYEMKEGDSVFDLLKKATKDKKIQMEYQGADGNSYGSAYIQGMNHLYEFSCGPLSGWMYEVNGVIPDYGVSKYVLKDKDMVAFRYTCDLGKDLGRE